MTFLHLDDLYQTWLNVHVGGAARARSSLTSIKMAACYLTGSIEGPSGRRPSLSVNSSKNFAIRVFDDGTLSMNLSYSAGVYNKENASIVWNKPVCYGSGKQPSVALMNIDEKLYSIVVHRSQTSKQCFFCIGEVDMDTKVITWEPPEAYCTGVKPKVSATDSGKIVFVNEKSYNLWDHMDYHIGKLVINNANPCIQFTIHDAPLSRTGAREEVFRGVEPDITINEDSAILIYRSGFDGIFSRLGIFIDNDSQITWYDAQPAPGTGINPCISLDSHNNFVESHQTKFGRKISRNHGSINQRDRKVVWGDQSLTTPTLGEYPAIALSNDGFIIEMHKSIFGNRLFQSYGELKNRLSLNNPEL